MEKSKKFRDRRIFKYTMYFVYLTGGAFLFALALYCYLSFYPFKTISVYNAPVPILNDVPVRIGEAVFYEVHYCKLTNAPTTTARTLIGADPKNNKLVVPSNPTLGNTLKSIYGDIKYRVGTNGQKIYDYPCNAENPQVRQSRAFIVPNNVPAGIYRLRIVSRYRVNPIREIPYEFTTQEFTIEDGTPRNPAPKPKNLSVLPPKTIEVQPTDQAEVVLEKVADRQTVLPKELEPTIDIKHEESLTINKPTVCLPIVGCMKE